MSENQTVETSIETEFKPDADGDLKPQTMEDKFFGVKTEIQTNTTDDDLSVEVVEDVPEEKTEGGILKASQTLKDEEVSNICGYVLKMGPDCYKDDKRFPSGAWCKVGDWVVFRAYSGTRMKMYGQEFRLINDDTVEAVVDDPTGVVRA